MVLYSKGRGPHAPYVSQRSQQALLPSVLCAALTALKLWISFILIHTCFNFFAPASLASRTLRKSPTPCITQRTVQTVELRLQGYATCDSTMTSSPDPYEALGLQRSPQPSSSEVKQAFRKLALQYHPDLYVTPLHISKLFNQPCTLFSSLPEAQKNFQYQL